MRINNYKTIKNITDVISITYILKIDKVVENILRKEKAKQISEESCF